MQMTPEFRIDFQTGRVENILVRVLYRADSKFKSSYEQDLIDAYQNGNPKPMNFGWDTIVFQRTNSHSIAALVQINP